MSGLSSDTAFWAAVVVVVIPAVIIAAAELDERLRQRESGFRRAVSILRTWSLPFFALWAVLVPVIALDRDSFFVRVAASGLVLSIAAAVLSFLRVVVDDSRRRPRTEGRRSIPQLVLILPRLATVLVAGWLLISTVWGVDLSAALTALGVTSLVVSFALQDTLSGLASGLLILGDQPFRTGDWISVGDVEGQVVDINWRTSRLRNRQGDMMIVPNSELAGSKIVNYTAPESLHRVTVPVQVAYVNAPTLAKAMLLDAAIGTPGVLADPPPGVRVVQVDDPLMGYEIDMWIDDYAIAPRVKSDFGSLVWYQSHRHGVPLPSPAQDLYLYDGVAAGTEEPITAGAIRAGLQQSPLLGSLEDADLDQLARSTRSVRYSDGELLVDSRDPTRDLLVIIEGRAHLVLLGPGDESSVVAEFGEGDALGLLDSSRHEGPDVAVQAVTDCVLFVVEADTAGEIASRNADVADTFNRMTSLRRRRIERIFEQRSAREQLEEPAG